MNRSLPESLETPRTQRYDMEQGFIVNRVGVFKKTAFSFANCPANEKPKPLVLLSLCSLFLCGINFLFFLTSFSSESKFSVFLAKGNGQGQGLFDNDYACLSVII